MCDACNKADAINFQIESPWVGLSQVQQKRISELEWIVGQFLKLEDKGHDGDGWSACPYCHGHELSSKHQRPNRKMDHQEDCFFIKARAVLEEK